MGWTVENIINFKKGEPYKDGYAQFGFHDTRGRYFVIDNKNHWIGNIEDSNLLWTAGCSSVAVSRKHFSIDFLNPHFITCTLDGALLLLCSGNKKIYKIRPEKNEINVFIDMEFLDIKDIGNCVCDLEGDIWVNEITGCRIWRFSADGCLKEVIGNGSPGFQKHTVSFEEAQFNWVYDIRSGLDGKIYVLDSKNYCVRVIDSQARTIALVAGTGTGGYSGDGNDALMAQLGSNPKAHYDGPWSMALDEQGNIYIGDTQNQVVRMVEKNSNKIYTIAGNRTESVVNKPASNVKSESVGNNPLKAKFPLISSMDYYKGRLYVPIWNYRLIILNKIL